MARRRKRSLRCEYREIVKNSLTGESALFRCGGPGLGPYTMCSEPGKHPPEPDQIDEDTGWPVETRGWTLEH